MSRVAFVAVALSLGGACNNEPPRAPAQGDADALVGPTTGTFSVPDAVKRPYFVAVPEGEGPFPLVIGLHAGGSRIEDFRQLTCPDGVPWSGACLDDLARSEGFVLVIPSGTSALFLDDRRSWNAGGGDNGYRCSAARGCEESVDDVGYLDTVVDEVRRAVAVDPTRVYAVGMGNGGAMAHRLACERSTVYAGVVDVAGANQVQTSQGCFPARPVPVLSIHGDADPCWGFAEETTCKNDEAGRLVSARDSFAAWRAMNGCALGEDAIEVSAVELIGDDDGTGAHREAGQGCVADAVLVVVEGGGHAWPLGHPYSLFEIAGKTSRRVSANVVAWEFLSSQHLPAVLLPEAL